MKMITDTGVRLRISQTDLLQTFFSRSHTNKDSKHSQQQDEDFKYKKTSQDSRQKYRHEEFPYRHHRDDSNSRPSSGYYKDKDSHEKSWDRSQERKQSQDYTSKSYAKPRETTDSPSKDYEDHRHNRARLSLNGSSGQSFESDVSYQIPANPVEKKTKGFQRFLDVLNKGVNVDTLTKIVTQNPEGGDKRPPSPISFMHPEDQPWSPSCDEVQQARDKNNSHRKENVRAQKVASPHHRSFSPKRSSLSDERSLQKGDGVRSFLSSSSRSRSPSVVEKVTLTPEEEHKHRQMQDVLQAIGMNLGFEELGQMSHRIQERLYGKKDSDRECHRRRNKERDTRRAFSPRLHSRSSSSRSSFSPPSQDYYMKEDADNAPRDLSEERQTQTLKPVEYDPNSSSNTFYDVKKYETNTQEKTAVSQAFSQNHTYTSSEPPPPSVMSAYSPVTSSPATPFPALPPAPPTNLPPARPPGLPPALPQALPQALPPALPPYFPNVGPRFLFPCRPPVFPMPHAPPPNLFPGLLPQTSHLLPQHMSNPQPPFFNLPHMNPIQPTNNTQNKKTASRPRCLQVIETKQAG
ncbi:actin cytoskeleton-regulatory complex protein PAN1-like [Notolabrus celidotus]|uniref:actin cytoskeleton-regulatory complex protein PAN1-like n=1 Tax=Notolabrus celidotus TaxID=1203425 RepID=UPI0014906C74|nr:actin cytoskeleton-regulatory complex protein PAN1-like [Notolabrus celidotus]XP_034544478.1 actin cytoskeleton-regulatory complex protein PAN1-like [Notolabrus celidotus]XP_034544479.1 actin cytoskeleton-regulatory complex protein PAN1-like [Notolabrus celidotus]